MRAATWRLDSMGFATDSARARRELRIDAID